MSDFTSLPSVVGTVVGCKLAPKPDKNNKEFYFIHIVDKNDNLVSPKRPIYSQTPVALGAKIVVEVARNEATGELSYSLMV